MAWGVGFGVITELIIPSVFSASDDHTSSGVPDIAESIGDVVASVLDGIVYSAIIYKILYNAYGWDRECYSTYASTRKIGKAMTSAMGYASLSLALLASGFKLMFRTVSEIFHTW